MRHAGNILRLSMIASNIAQFCLSCMPPILGCSPSVSQWSGFIWESGCTIYLYLGEHFPRRPKMWLISHMTHSAGVRFVHFYPIHRIYQSHNGFHEGMAYLPMQQAQIIVYLIKKFLASRFLSTRITQKLLGYMPSTMAVTPHARLHVWPLQNWFIWAFSPNLDSQRKKFLIPKWPLGT